MASKQVQDLLGQMQKNLECSICLEMMTNPVSTNCGHQFCRFCLMEFLERKRQVPCPLCKKAITKRSLTERGHLGEMVSSVRNLIQAFQQDTGAIFSPPRGSAMNMLSCTPELIQTKPGTRQTATLADRPRSNVRRSVRKPPAVPSPSLPSTDGSESISITETSTTDRTTTTTPGSVERSRSTFTRDMDQNAELLRVISEGTHGSENVRSKTRNNVRKIKANKSVKLSSEQDSDSAVDVSEILSNRLVGMIDDGSEKEQDLDVSQPDNDFKTRTISPSELSDVSNVKVDGVLLDNNIKTNNVNINMIKKSVEKSQEQEDTKLDSVKNKSSKDLHVNIVKTDDHVDLSNVADTQSSVISEGDHSNNEHNLLFRTPQQVNKSKKLLGLEPIEQRSKSRSLRSREKHEDNTKAIKRAGEEVDVEELTPDYMSERDESFLQQKGIGNTYSRKGREQHKDKSSNKKVVEWLKSVANEDKGDIVTKGLNVNEVNCSKVKKVTKKDLKIQHNEEIMGQKIKHLAKHVQGELLFNPGDFASSPDDKNLPEDNFDISINETDLEVESNTKAPAPVENICKENMPIDNSVFNVIEHNELETSCKNLDGSTSNETVDNQKQNNLIQKKRIFKSRANSGDSLMEVNKPENGKTTESVRPKVDKVNKKLDKLESADEKLITMKNSSVKENIPAKVEGMFAKPFEIENDSPQSDPYEFKSTGLTPRKSGKKGKKKKTKLLSSKTEKIVIQNGTMKKSTKYDSKKLNVVEDVALKKKTATQLKLEKLNAEINQAEDYDLLTCTQEAAENFIEEQKKRGTNPIGQTGTVSYSASNIEDSTNRKVHFREPIISDFISPGKIDIIAYRKAKLAETVTKARDVGDEGLEQQEGDHDSDDISEDYRFHDDSSGTDDLDIQPEIHQIEPPNMDIQPDGIAAKLSQDVLSQLSQTSTQVGNSSVPLPLTSPVANAPQSQVTPEVHQVSPQVIEETPALFAVPKFMNRPSKKSPLTVKSQEIVAVSKEKKAGLSKDKKSVKDCNEVTAIPETPVILKQEDSIKSVPETPFLGHELEETPTLSNEMIVDTVKSGFDIENKKEKQGNNMHSHGIGLKNETKVNNKKIVIDSSESDRTQSPIVEIDEDADSQTKESKFSKKSKTGDFDISSQENNRSALESIPSESLTQDSESLLLPKFNSALKTNKESRIKEVIKDLNAKTELEIVKKLSQVSSSGSSQSRKGKRKCFMLGDSPPSSLDFGSLPDPVKVESDLKSKRPKTNRLRRSPKQKALFCSHSNSSDSPANNKEVISLSENATNVLKHKTEVEGNKELDSDIVMIPDSVRSDMSTLEPDNVDIIDNTNRNTDSANIRNKKFSCNKISQNSVISINSMSQKSNASEVFIVSQNCRKSNKDNKSIRRDKDPINKSINDEVYDSMNGVLVEDSAPMLVDSSTYSVNVIPETEYVEGYSEQMGLDLDESLDANNGTEKPVKHAKHVKKECDTEIRKSNESLKQTKTHKSASQLSVNSDSSCPDIKPTSQDEQNQTKPKKRHVSGLLLSPEDTLNRSVSFGSPEDIFQGQDSEMPILDMTPNMDDTIRPVELSEDSADELHFGDTEINIKDEDNVTNDEIPETITKDKYYSNDEIKTVDNRHKKAGDISNEVESAKAATYTLKNKTEEKEMLSKPFTPEKVDMNSDNDTNSTGSSRNKRRSTTARGFTKKTKSSGEFTDSTSTNSRSPLSRTPSSFSSQKYKSPVVKFISPRMLASKMAASPSNIQVSLESDKNINLTPLKSKLALGSKITNPMKYSPSYRKKQNGKDNYVPSSPVSKAEIVDLKKELNSEESDFDPDSQDLPDLEFAKSYDVKINISTYSDVEKNVKTTNKISPKVVLGSPRSRDGLLVIENTEIKDIEFEDEEVTFKTDMKMDKHDNSQEDIKLNGGTTSQKGISGTTTVPDSIPENNTAKQINDTKNDHEIENTDNENEENNCNNSFQSSSSSEFRLDLSDDEEDNNPDHVKQVAIDVISKFNEIREGSEIIDDRRISKKGLGKNDFNTKSKEKSLNLDCVTNINETDELNARYSTNLDSSPMKAGDEIGSRQVVLESDDENFEDNIGAKPKRSVMGRNNTDHMGDVGDSLGLDPESDDEVVHGNNDNDDYSDDDGEVIVRRKHNKKAVIADSSTEEEDDSIQHMNMTSSSAFSSQSENLTTQDRDGLMSDLERMAVEMKAMKEQIQKNKRESLAGNLKKQATVSPHSVSMVIDDSEDEAVIEADDSDIAADDDDMFMSPPPMSPGRSQTPPNVAERLSQQTIPSQSHDSSQVPPTMSSDRSIVPPTLSPDHIQATPTLSETQPPMSETQPPMSETQPPLSETQPPMSPEECQQKMHTDKQENTLLEQETAVVVKQEGSQIKPLNEKLSRSERPILTDIDSNIVSSTTPDQSQHGRTIRCVTTGLSTVYVQCVKKLMARHDAKFFTKFNDSVTHVIVKPADEDDTLCDRTLKFFQGIAHKCWIVNHFWVIDSREVGYILPEGPYEIQGDTANGDRHEGPKRSRLSKHSLFSDFMFSVVGDNTYLSKDSMIELIHTCGGTVVDLGSLGQGHQRSLVVTCTDIEDESSQEHRDIQSLSRDVYRKHRIVTVTREWVLDSLTLYKLQPLREYVVTDVKNINIPSV